MNLVRKGPDLASCHRNRTIHRRRDTYDTAAALRRTVFGQSVFLTSSGSELTLTRLNLQFPHPFRLFAWALRFLSGPSWKRDAVAGMVGYVRSDAYQLLVYEC
jgi:hypothetical protein